MTVEAYATLAILTGLFGLHIETNLPPAAIFVGALTLVITFRLAPLEACLRGLSNIGMLTIGALFMVAAGMYTTGAILDLPASRYTAVRPGLLLYGYYPSKDVSRSIPLRQVMAFRTQVAHVRSLPSDTPISYGRRWSTPDATWIAVLPVGYADGVRRDLTDRGSVSINGKSFPMVGTVTMDHIMVHVGADEIRPGDEALL
jgi:alanine racemase